jgi:four helix bundle protein
MSDDYKTYKELKVWQVGRKLVSSVYELTKRYPKDELYGIVNQMRRCAVSIPSNIAEGCGRRHYKESINFFYIAKGSLYELETQLYLSFDQKYIVKEELDNQLKEIEECERMLCGLINYYSKESVKKN